MCQTKEQSELQTKEAPRPNLCFHWSCSSRTKTRNEPDPDEEQTEDEDEEASDRATVKARKWDDWKDDHEKGAGNKKKNY